MDGSDLLPAAGDCEWIRLLGVDVEQAAEAADSTEIRTRFIDATTP
jgi:hypothetical protein